MFCKAQIRRGVDLAWLSLLNPSNFFDILTIGSTIRGSCFSEDGNPNVSTGISSGLPDPRPQKAFGTYYLIGSMSSVRHMALTYITHLKESVLRQHR